MIFFIDNKAVDGKLASHDHMIIENCSQMCATAFEEIKTMCLPVTNQQVTTGITMQN